ncbi:MAG: hypothetical protein CMP22_06235 [Rickettsiales bacterium]|nr:hypothetical protein [Rickettsiales bacterium]
MKLILCRHGNTFGPGDVVVWTGSSNDLPLVEKGFEQARNVAMWLKNDQIAPDVIYASRLKRAHDFATTIKDQNDLSADILEDDRLAEVDYGDWTGITDEAVADKFGLDVIEAWRQNNQFPPKGQWGESEQEVLNRTKAFIDDLLGANKDSDKTILVISSNGILRFLLKAFSSSLYEEQAKGGGSQVKTGRVCMLDIEGGQPNLKFWNKDPLDLI